jgi:hypothetical protein
VADDVRERQGAEEWASACLGYVVSLPGDERGRVDAIRVRNGNVELVVTVGSSPRRLVAVGSEEIEAILPRARRLIVRGAPAAADRLETRGGIVRMPPRNSSRIAPGANEAA